MGVEKTRPTLCLNMIVRDEAGVIARALASVRPFVDHWVIVDTGSSDGTPDIVRAAMDGVPGNLHERPWVDFGHNRNEALELAAGAADWLLFMDADMTVEAPAPFQRRLEADAYLVGYAGSVDYHQVMLVSTAHEWRYRGRTHEAIHSPTARRVERADFLRLRHHCDGSSRAVKLERDARLLRETLEEDPGDARAVFYLAMTLKDLGEHDEALELYRRRADLGGWEEEVWCSLYHQGLVHELRGAPWAEALEAYLAAYQRRPGRLEPLHRIARHYRERGEHALAWLYAHVAEETPYPDDMLFVERSVYEVELPMEHAVSAQWVGRPAEALAIYNRLLERPDLPPLMRHGILRNERYSLEALLPPRDEPVSGPNRVTVVVPFHNPGAFLDVCLSSLLRQDHPDFRVVLLDDASTDGSSERVPADDPRFTLVRNEERRGGAYNLHVAFTEHCIEDDIVVHLDGDDWLAVPDALSFIDAAYRAHGCHVLYGQYRQSDGHLGRARPFADARDFRRLRDVWYTTAVRTFRAALYHRIAEQDPDYACMKDARGGWYQEAMDMAYMYPVCEIAGFQRVRYNPRVLYVYNVANPLSVHRTRRAEELRAAKEIAAKPRFEPVSLPRLG